MSGTLQTPDALVDRTNTRSGGGRSASTATSVKASGKIPKATHTGAGSNNDVGALQTAIPGAKPAVKPAVKRGRKVAPGDVANQERAAAAGSTANAAVSADTVAGLHARIAELEAQRDNAAQPLMNGPTARAQGGTPAARGTPRTGAPPPRTPAPPPRTLAPIPAPRIPAPPLRTPARVDTGAHHDHEHAPKMIPKPRGKESIQVGMRLARSTEGHALYGTACATVRECVSRADLDVAVPWDKQPLEKRALVINAAKGKVAYLQRMENDWATQALARQYMKNRRSRAYLKGTLERPEGYDHLKNNAARRSISGSRVKKAKVVLEARLAKRALEDNEDRTADRPRKKARAPTPNSQPEFVQGSSRDGRDQVGNPWDAHPQIDDDFVPEDEEDFSGAERDEMDRDRFADDSEPGSE